MSKSPSLHMELSNRIKNLPSDDQPAVERLLADVGPDRLLRIVKALAAQKRGPRGVELGPVMALLRMMVPLIRSGKTVHGAARDVASSDAGRLEEKKRSAGNDAVVRHLRETWKVHGSQLMREPPPRRRGVTGYQTAAFRTEWAKLAPGLSALSAPGILGPLDPATISAIVRGMGVDQAALRNVLTPTELMIFKMGRSLIDGDNGPET